VRLLAMSKKEMPIAQRARIPKEIEQGFTLFHGLPEEGGYAEPVRIESWHREDLFAQQEREEASQEARDFIRAACDEDSERVASIIPFAEYRRRCLKSLEAMAPRPETGILLREDSQKDNIIDICKASSGARIILSKNEKDEIKIRKGYISAKIKKDEYLDVLGSRKEFPKTYFEDSESIPDEETGETVQIYGEIAYGEDEKAREVYLGDRFSHQFGSLPFGYDHKYVYSHFGYNLKATDMQAAIGCAQLKKLDQFSTKRQANHKRLLEGLKDLGHVFYLPLIFPNTKPSPFGFLLTIRDDVGSNLSRNAMTMFL